MEWTLGRKLSLIVAGADILVARAVILSLHGEIAGALFSVFFLGWGLWFVWFPERVGNFSVFVLAAMGFPDLRFDLSLVSFAGWVMLVMAVPAIFGF